jgi:uncharacterized membrane protein/uncharacterized protein YjeT (DUF2065 family)
MSRRLAAHRGGEKPPDTTAGRSRLPVSVVALSAAIGVLVVAAAYTAGRLGRSGAPWSDWAYWVGQLLILTPVAARMLSRRSLAGSETATLVVVLTVAEYLVKVCYSPAAFTYADELMHWRTAADITQTGRLFTPNNLLPISPYYPGLEEVTTALASVTGLSVFVSGLIVAGTAHLLFVCTLFVLFRYAGGSHRVAGVALILYASESLFSSFDSMFVYQTLALPFFGLTLLATYRLAVPQAAGHRAGWFTVAVLSACATVVTHHVTSYLLVATLELITLGALLTRDRRLAAWASVLALVSAAAFGAWILFVAPSTVGYLQPVIQDALQGFQALLAGSHHPAPPPVSAANGPLENQALAAAAVLIMSVLVPVGWWQAWRRYRRQPWVVAFAIGAVSWYVIVAVRLFVANGSELAGRASTFVFLPAGFIAALAVIRLTDNSLRWLVIRAGLRRAPLVIATAVAAALMLVLNGLINGWPPYWERLPGPYQVAGAERSVGPEQVASADWALAVLGPGQRFATDEGDLPVLGSYGDQNTVGDDGPLYTSPALTPAAVQLVQAQSIGFVLVDLRLSETLPVSGQYFPVDPNAGTYKHPLPRADLAKFNRVPGVARIYDSGNIVIYDLKGSAYYGP